MDNRLSSVQGLFKFSTSDGAGREYGLNSGREGSWPGLEVYRQSVSVQKFTDKHCAA